MSIEASQTYFPKMSIQYLAMITDSTPYINMVRVQCSISRSNDPLSRPPNSVQCPLEVENIRQSRDVAVLDFSYKFGTNLVNNKLRLPTVLNKFFQPIPVSAEEFFPQWRLLAGPPLKLQEVWQCHICLKNYSLKDIIIDPYLNRIVNMMQHCVEDVAEIEVKSDGSWRAKIGHPFMDLERWHLADGSLCVGVDSNMEVPGGKSEHHRSRFPFTFEMLRP